MQTVTPLNVLVSTIVRQAGGNTRTAESASNALEQREIAIAANLREFAVRQGMNNDTIDALFQGVGLTCRPAVDPAVAQATSRIERAEAELAQARADLARAAR